MEPGPRSDTIAWVRAIPLPAASDGDGFLWKTYPRCQRPSHPRTGFHRREDGDWNKGRTFCEKVNGEIAAAPGRM
jgi:hypothetical protein